MVTVRSALTAVPQRTALSHAFGGLAAGLVGTAKYYLWVSEGPEQLTPFRMVAIVAEIILAGPTSSRDLLMNCPQNPGLAAEPPQTRK